VIGETRSTEGEPLQTHRTVDRVTQILETVVYEPGITFVELARVVDAPRSSVHGFIRGLLAKGWLYQHDRGFYLGPAIYGLALVSGHIRAGQVTQADLSALHAESGLTVFLGVEAADHLIYVGESGADSSTGFAARTNIRRDLIATAGGKALLAEWHDAALDAYLRRYRQRDEEAVAQFLGELKTIRESRIATNVRLQGAQLAMATVVRNTVGDAVAALVLVGPSDDMRKRETRLRKTLLKHVDAWSSRHLNPREVI
jgi:DNA-binding IclR family transcriptional regulator